MFDVSFDAALFTCLCSLDFCGFIVRFWICVCDYVWVSGVGVCVTRVYVLVGVVRVDLIWGCLRGFSFVYKRLLVASACLGVAFRAWLRFWLCGDCYWFSFCFVLGLFLMVWFWFSAFYRFETLVCFAFWFSGFEIVCLCVDVPWVYVLVADACTFWVWWRYS